jgi:hypothetical protein
MGNLEKRIDALESANIYTPPVGHITDEELAESINRWIAEGGPADARRTQDPDALRMLEILEEAHRRNLAMQLYKRIEALERTITETPPRADEMTAEELLAICPQSVTDLLAKMEFEDLDELSEALEQGREPNLSPEGAAIAEQIGVEWDKHHGKPSNTP